EFFYLPPQIFVFGGQIIPTFRAAIAPRFLRPSVPVDAEAETAELTQDGRTARLQRRRGGTGIGMEVEDVADFHIVPAARAVDQAVQWEFRDPVGPIFGV